jgi:hypothetical protein
VRDSNPHGGWGLAITTAEKKLKKPLDKQHKMCYNKGTKRETSCGINQIWVVTYHEIGD